MSPRRCHLGGSLLIPFRPPFTAFWIALVVWGGIFLVLRWTL